MLIATFLIPPEALALERALRDFPEMEVEAERIAAHSTRWVMPCLWVAEADFDSVDDALANDPTVANVVETEEFADEKYYNLEWSDAVKERVDLFLDMEASILDASATAAGWKVRVRFASREQFDVFREYFDEHDHSFELLDLTEPGAPRQSYGELTPDQRNALVVAVERGYYRVPREVSARELAEELGISHQALSERLRRGMENLVHSTLVTRKETAHD